MLSCRARWPLAQNPGEYGPPPGGLADDALGNLLSMGVFKCSGPSLSVSVNSKNQISSSGFSYDADGEMTNDANYTYAFNGANEVTSANGVTYTGACPERSRRDGDALYASRMVLRDGLRVEKSSGTLYWRTYTGQVIEARSLRPEWLYGKTNTSGQATNDYIFFDGRRIGWVGSTGASYYIFTDAIGSTRAVTNITGSVCFSADYYPYGQENDYVTSCSPTYKFAGYEFDSETGNYYANARYYNPRLGRFMTPDFTLAVVGSPQSLNGYSYIANNPTSYAGPREMPPAFGAPAGDSAEALIAVLIAEGPTIPAGGGWTGAATTPVPSHPLGATPQMAQAAEMEVRAFLAYLRSHAPKPTSPYGSAFGGVCDAFPGAPGVQSYPGKWAAEAGCGNVLAPVLVSQLPKNWNGMTLSEQESWYYLNHYQSGFDAIFGTPSASGSNVAEGLPFYTHAYGFPAENDIPIGGNLMGDWLDAGFPQFDMQMFFGGGGGGGGGNYCLPTPWDMDPCSF